MSDNEDYYNNNSSDSDSSSDIDIPVSKNKNVSNFKPNVSVSLNIKDYDSDDDSVEEDNPDDDIIDDDDDVYDPDNPDDIQFEDDNDNDDDMNEQEGGADSDDEDDANTNKKSSKINTKLKDKNIKTKEIIEPSDDDEDYDDDDDDDENYLQKFDAEINKSYIPTYHPECTSHNYDEIAKLSKIVKDKNGIIIDPFHKTLPFLTKYEKTRILGQRAKQIENGAKPFVKVPDNIIDSYIIAELELQQKRIPFIIRRPLPCGGCEYWNLKDLELIAF